MSETFRITFLGTSAAVPTTRRNVSATLVAYQDLKWLIDCGEGTQRQIMRANIGFKNLARVVLSHEHLDHILGMGGLLATLNMLQPVEHVVVYGNPTVLERVRQMTSYIGRVAQYDLQLQVLQEGLVFTHRQLECYAFPTRQRAWAFLMVRNAAASSRVKACRVPVDSSSTPMTCSVLRNLAKSSSTSAIRCISLNSAVWRRGLIV